VLAHDRGRLEEDDAVELEALRRARGQRLYAGRQLVERGLLRRVQRAERCVEVT